MKFSIKNPKENIISLMRKVGYYFLEQEKGDLSFVKPLERSGYPRFHIYLEIDEKINEIIFNLHLDQKRPIYRGAPAHAGEYDGELVEKEAERIKQIITQ
jgi:hypothetical protein